MVKKMDCQHGVQRAPCIMLAQRQQKARAMEEEMKQTIEAIRLAGKAARQAGQAAQAAQSAFQQIIGAIRAEKLESLFVVKTGNEYATRDSRTLNEHEQKLMQEIRQACINAYGWPNVKASANFRHWRFRVANELSGKTIAEKSRKARQAAKAKQKATQEQAIAALKQELECALKARNVKTARQHVQAALKMLG